MAGVGGSTPSEGTKRMTIHEKVRALRNRTSQLAEDEPLRHKQFCFTLLHDSILWSDSRIDQMGSESLIGLIELVAVTVQSQAPSVRDVRRSLLKLGFNVAPPGALN